MKTQLFISYDNDRYLGKMLQIFAFVGQIQSSVCSNTQVGIEIML